MRPSSAIQCRTVRSPTLRNLAESTCERPSFAMAVEYSAPVIQLFGPSSVLLPAIVMVSLVLFMNHRLGRRAQCPYAFRLEIGPLVLIVKRPVIHQPRQGFGLVISVAPPRGKVVLPR